MKWHNIEKGRSWFVGLMLKWKAKSLERFCRRHKLNYCDVYLIDSDGSATINFMAKRNGIVITEGYAFVKSRAK